MITVNQMKALEAEAEQKGMSKLRLMENAGAGVVVALEHKYGDKLGEKYPVIFCGTGNNGGDGFVVARYLSNKCFVFLFLLGSQDKLEGIAAANFVRLKGNFRVEIIETKSANVLKHSFNRIQKKIKEKNIVLIDAMIGTGLKKELKEPLKTAVTLMNKSKAFKVSVDVPSGMDPDTGEGKHTVEPDLVVTFHDVKQGLKNLKEKIIVVDIGIPR